jgi:hypothetical protein
MRLVPVVGGLDEPTGQVDLSMILGRATCGRHGKPSRNRNVNSDRKCSRRTWQTGLNSSSRLKAWASPFAPRCANHLWRTSVEFDVGDGFGVPDEVVDSLRANVLSLAARRKPLIAGGLAQLGERLAGSQKVRGSSPLSST